jgi:hypothetical protein
MRRLSKSVEAGLPLHETNKLSHRSPMNNAPSIEVLQSQNHFSDVHSSGSKPGCAITAIQILHNKIFGLESVIELDDERRLHLLHENHAFCIDIGDLILRDHVCFANCVVISYDFLLSQNTEPKASLLIGLMISKSLTDDGVAREWPLVVRRQRALGHTIVTGGRYGTQGWDVGQLALVTTNDRFLQRYEGRDGRRSEELGFEP